MSIFAFAVWGMMAMSTGPSGLSAAAANAERAELRRIRLQNNEALVARDLARTMQIAADDYILVGGNDGIRRSRSEMQEDWSRSFADPSGLPCIRRPDRFEVGEYAGVRRAAEVGSWECPASTREGIENLFGRYLAHWSKRSGSWKVISDNYVTLGCRGPGCKLTR